MKKIIKKYGNSTIIRLSPEDLKIYEMKAGDFVEMHLRKLKKEDIEELEMEGDDY